MQKTGFQMLNDDEIVTSVQEESDPVDDETDEDKDNNNDESSKGSSNSGPFLLSGFIYCMGRIRYSVIRTIANPNGVRSQLIRINDVLLYNKSDDYR
ncbi:hypothetical protein TNCV_3870721 [Trichonephila clavipes]|nr:hypothetical protein TNCV_3870721 [Trichonephila clavipes]